MSAAVFYTPRTYFTVLTSEHRDALLGAGCPAAWLSALLEPRAARYAWLGQVLARPVGVLVGEVDGDALHVEGWLAPDMRGLGLASEAIDGLAAALFVRPGHVPGPDDRPFVARHSPTRLVMPSDAARVAERCGARPHAGAWQLDLVGHTGLARAPFIDGKQVARLIASLRPSEAAAVEALARAHLERLQAAAAAAAARARTKPVARFRGVQDIVDAPPTQPADASDVERLLEHAYAERLADVVALVGRRHFADDQLLRIRMALDDGDRPASDRCAGWADICEWLSDYERVRKG